METQCGNSKRSSTWGPGSQLKFLTTWILWLPIRSGSLSFRTGQYNDVVAWNVSNLSHMSDMMSGDVSPRCWLLLLAYLLFIATVFKLYCLLCQDIQTVQSQYQVRPSTASHCLFERVPAHHKGWAWPVVIPRIICMAMAWAEKKGQIKLTQAILKS